LWTALLLSVASSAFAAEWGRMVLLSSAGEPLRAEIEVPARYTEAEIPVLQLAPAEAYAPAGLKYDPALAAARFRFDLRADGRPYYSLQSARPVAATQIALLVERVAPGPRERRAYLLQVGGSADRGAVFAPVSPRPSAAARTSARVSANEARWVREIERMQSEVDTQGQTLASMLERVAALEVAVKELQRGQEARAKAAAAPPPMQPVPVAPPTPVAVERENRPGLSAAWVNHSLLILVAGFLLLMMGIGGWILWGPSSRAAKAASPPVA
jgi:pilus assembly protein FimV